MKKLFLVFFFLCAGTVVWGQTPEQKKLEQRKTEILKEIQSLNTLVSSEKAKEKSLLTKISDSETKIELSKKLIATIQKQTRLLNDDIYRNQLKINKLNRELKVLKEDYAKTLLLAYKNRSTQSRIMFILSSDNFLQAYKRMQYMKQYAGFRKMQGEEIRGKMTELEALNTKLQSQKKEKDKLLVDAEKQKAQLVDDKKEQEKLVKAVQKDKKKYTAEINDKKKETKKIQSQIDKLIREAIAAANKKTAASSSESSSTKAAAASGSSSKIVLTKEGQVVANNFTANKGKLPWPVTQGYVSMGYGNQSYPGYSDIQIFNSGIEISTTPGAEIRTIFGGEVSMVQLDENTNTKTVYIQHGNYISVYKNLGTVSVSAGTKVSLKQSIGTAYTSPSGKTAINFYILQNTTYLNPQTWITPLR
ncbi:murein hydrolase activator EnvC family protein [Flavobacterium rhizosphaerae]|uniref:Peptidoglycan DD-metalloendopeptidase family protein n=1 Tax=Flavobacterium rhizosphaerae TaxID=3163298 RepID=A0ABW8YZ99_9FLAO